MGAQPIVLVRADDPEKKPLLYACGKCGNLTSPRIFACKDEEAHATAKQFAQDCYHCKTRSICQSCGDQCGKNWTACEKCIRKKKFEAATQVTLDGVEECFGFDGGDFYRSPEDAADDGEDWVYLATFRHFSIDLERLEESILDDHHEDASASDLKGWDKLWKTIEKFNKAQTSGSFDEDRSRISKVSHLRDPDESNIPSEGLQT